MHQFKLHIPFQCFFCHWVPSYFVPVCPISDFFRRAKIELQKKQVRATNKKLTPQIDGEQMGGIEKTNGVKIETISMELENIMHQIGMICFLFFLASSLSVVAFFHSHTQREAFIHSPIYSSGTMCSYISIASLLAVLLLICIYAFECALHLMVCLCRYIWGDIIIISTIRFEWSEKTATTTTTKNTMCLCVDTYKSAA